MTKIAVLLLFAALASAGPIETLPVGQWYEVPNSHMDAVKHSVNGPNMWDVSCVIGCWCGGALDTKRNHMIVWGGGHGQYSGNEIYYFDLDSLKWIRENDPSNPPSNDGVAPYYYAPDGNPGSRHSANTMQYIQSIDRFVVFGGCGFYPGGQSGTNNVEYYDFNARKWETRVSTIPSNAGGATYGFGVYDAGSGIAYSHGSWSSSQMARYNLSTKAWTSLTLPSNNRFMDNGWGVTAAIDPKLHQMVILGSSDFVYTLPGSGTSVNVSTLVTTGDNAIQDGHTPGLDYDPVTERMIGWTGGQSIYSLNLATRVWTLTAATGANPGAPDGNGTYGRFRYCPKKNVFIVVNASDRNVCIYRHTAATSAPQWYLDLLNQDLAVQGSGLKAIASSAVVTPNPFRSAVSIKTGGPSAIYDLSGRLVFSTKAHEFVWNAAGLPEGIYMLKSPGKAQKLVLMK